MHKASNGIEEVPYGFLRSSVKFKVALTEKLTMLTVIENFWTVTLVKICRWLLNNAHSFK